MLLEVVVLYGSFVSSEALWKGLDALGKHLRTLLVVGFLLNGWISLKTSATSRNGYAIPLSVSIVGKEIEIERTMLHAVCRVSVSTRISRQKEVETQKTSVITILAF